MRASTTKDRDLLSQFHTVYESEAQINKTTLKHLLVKNRDVAGIKGKKGKLPLEYFFDLVKHSKKLP